MAASVLLQTRLAQGPLCSLLQPLRRLPDNSGKNERLLVDHSLLDLVKQLEKFNFDGRNSIALYLEGDGPLVNTQEQRHFRALLVFLSDQKRLFRYMYSRQRTRSVLATHVIPRSVPCANYTLRRASMQVCGGLRSQMRCST